MPRRDRCSIGGRPGTGSAQGWGSWVPSRPCGLFNVDDAQCAGMAGVRRSHRGYGCAALWCGRDEAVLARVGLYRHLHCGVAPDHGCLVRQDPALLERRMRGGPMFETERTQRIIMTFTSLGFIALLVVPALDRRFGWSSVPVWAVVLGDVLVAIGYCFHPSRLS